MTSLLYFLKKRVCQTEWGYRAINVVALLLYSGTALNHATRGWGFKYDPLARGKLSPFDTPSILLGVFP